MALTKYNHPKTLGGMADRLWRLKEKRLELTHQVQAIEEEEKVLREIVINTLPKSEATGASGKLANVKVVTKTVPSLTNFEELWKWAVRNKAPDIFQRRLNNKAITDRWDAGKKVAGVEPFQAVTISLTKVK